MLLKHKIKTKKELRKKLNVRYFMTTNVLHLSGEWIFFNNFTDNDNFLLSHREMNAISPHFRVL